MYDLIIIGGGPGGVSAGVYASRKQLTSAIITEDFGGQSVVSNEIQNWIGTISMSGSEWANMLENHLRAYADTIVDIKKGTRVQNITKHAPYHFKILTEDNEELESKSVLITTGSHRRKLNIPGAEKFDNKGVTYCASCDGPLFANQDVAVIGGGNAGFESAAELLAYTNSVTLLHHRDEFKADPITVDKVQQHDTFTAITNAEPIEIQGDDFVEKLVYKDMKTNTTNTLSVSGIFVEIGLIPNTHFVKDVVPLNKYNQIEIDPWTQQATQDGIWAAGDCTNVLYHQNNIAAGDGVRALEDIYKTIF